MRGMKEMAAITNSIMSISIGGGAKRVNGRTAQQAMRPSEDTDLGRGMPSYNNQFSADCHRLGFFCVVRAKSGLHRGRAVLFCPCGNTKVCSEFRRSYLP